MIWMLQTTQKNKRNALLSSQCHTTALSWCISIRWRLCKNRKNTRWREKEEINADNSDKQAQIFQPTWDHLRNSFSKLQLINWGICGGVAKSQENIPLIMVSHYKPHSILIREKTSFSQIERLKQGSLTTFGPEVPLRTWWKPGNFSSENCLYSQNTAFNFIRIYWLTSLLTTKPIPIWVPHCLVGLCVKGL